MWIVCSASGIEWNTVEYHIADLIIIIVHCWCLVDQIISQKFVKIAGLRNNEMSYEKKMQ